MPSFAVRALLATSLVLTCGLASAQPRRPSTLPLTRVRLYETGVGYFERKGGVGSGSNNVVLPVPPGHLDDALKTLVVLAADSGTTVSGIEFGSSVSRNMGRALAGLPAAEDAPITYETLLTSLKGASVEIMTAAGKHTGRIIDVLPPTASDGPRPCQRENRTVAGRRESVLVCSKKAESTVLLVTRKSEVRRFRAGEIRSVRPTDPAFKSRLGSALDALSPGAEGQRKLRVLSNGGNVTLGYVAEAPVWRSTYRLVFGTSAEVGTLQGWALLHNDTDEDWKQVSVELVNGRPDSFLFPLAAPRYARRELVTPDHELSTVPQLFGRTVDNMWSVESYGVGGLGLSGVGAGGGGRGEGIGLGSIGTIGHGAGVGTDMAQSSLLAVGSLANIAQSEGVEAGALFRYKLASPVDLRAHGSALLPFAAQQVTAKRIACVSAPGKTARSAVHFTNGTRQTLPAGTLAVFADDGFAGESALSRTKPTESRFIRYGYDLDVEVEEESTRQRDVPRILAFNNDVLTEHFVRHHRVRYKVSNRSGSDRKVYLALSFVDNATVKGADGLEFDTEASKAFAVFDVAGRTEPVRTIQVEEGLRRTRTFDELTSKTLRALASHDALPAGQRELLRAAASRLNEAAALRRAAAKTRQEMTELTTDISRLHTHVRALGSTQNAAAEALSERLLRAENRATALRRSIRLAKAKAKRRVGRARAALLKLAKAKAKAKTAAAGQK